MNSTKVHCRNASQDLQSTTNNCVVSSAFETSESILQNPNIKLQNIQRSNIGMTTIECSMGNNGKTSLTTGNEETNVGHCYNNTNRPSEIGDYINVMSVPMGTLQYHRRKLTPQEYQSSLYYNAIPPTSSVPFKEHQHYNSSQNQYLQIAHQKQQQFSHQSNQHQIFSQQIDSIDNCEQAISCSQTPVRNPVDAILSCSLLSGSGRMAAATQTHQGAENLQLSVPTSSSLGSMSRTGPPIMYTVHRVVTTAQIQTAAGNTFASSSSVSSVVSAVRNESDIGNVLTPDSINPNSSNFATGDISDCFSGIICDASNNNNYNLSIGQSQLCSLTGSNSSNLPNSTKGSSSPNSHLPDFTPKSSATFSSNSKTSSSIPRTLQNVIPMCVYLMSRVAVHMEIEGTSQCPSQVMLAAALGCEELGIANKLLAQSIFGLWMTSSLLDIQLKAHNRPYAVRISWGHLLDKFCHGTAMEKKFDEPMIMLKRNVFFSKRDEEKIKDHRILELLYEEAKHNVLSGRYIMEHIHSLMLGGIQARIELGPFNSHSHTNGFFRENQSRFLPHHVAKNSNWSWLPVSRKNSAEVRLLEQFKRVPQTATTRKLMRKYLEFCWALPFYGSAFFYGQVEQSVSGIWSFISRKDIDVYIAINERGVYIMDSIECTLLLGLRYEDLSWDYAKPSSADDPDCLTCIFLQFDVMDNGIQISKLMQIFSKQAPMMDALISHFAEHINKRKTSGRFDQVHDEPNPIQNYGNGVLCNKLSRLTLATFDDEGRCIGQMGSISISF